MAVFHESELDLQRDEDASQNVTGKLLPRYSIKSEKNVDNSQEFETIKSHMHRNLSFV